MNYHYQRLIIIIRLKARVYHSLFYVSVYCKNLLFGYIISRTIKICSADFFNFDTIGIFDCPKHMRLKKILNPNFELIAIVLNNLLCFNQ